MKKSKRLTEHKTYFYEGDYVSTKVGKPATKEEKIKAAARIENQVDGIIVSIPRQSSKKRFKRVFNQSPYV